jgi:hypothetical protein
VCVKIRRNYLRQQQKQSEILRFAIFRSVVKRFDVAWSSWSIFLLVYGRLNVINTESLSTLLIILEHYYNYFSTPPYNKTLHCFFFSCLFFIVSYLFFVTKAVKTGDEKNVSISKQGTCWTTSTGDNCRVRYFRCSMILFIALEVEHLSEF